jgi:hypothetical protein
MFVKLVLLITFFGAFFNNFCNGFEISVKFCVKNTHTVNFFYLLQVFFCVCALFSLLSAAPAAQPQLVLSSLGAAAAIAAAAGLKGAVIAGQ